MCRVIVNTLFVLILVLLIKPSLRNGKSVGVQMPGDRNRRNYFPTAFSVKELRKGIETFATASVRCDARRYWLSSPSTSSGNRDTTECALRTRSSSMERDQSNPFGIGGGYEGLLGRGRGRSKPQHPAFFTLFRSWKASHEPWRRHSSTHKTATFPH